ncbi:DHA2 family efflux MFS transporter permease subunit [Cohnella sp.]|uniref:DHA2 family efflux MFS transporter permease subunit n=1 Tax=Cohnella sp. TaxID=1883426 RepID=UPI0035669689
METESGKMPKSRLNWLMAALLLSIFLTQLDQTIVSIALPTIVAKLNGFDQMSWVFTVYMLASTVVMPIAGKLSDIYGRKQFYLFGLVLFVAGSALCGMAGSMMQLVLFRGIQGIGAGFLTPVTFILVVSITPRERMGIYNTLYLSVFALSSVVGPSLGALITEYFDWRWNFYINLPLGLFIFLIANKLLVKSTVGEQRPSIDVAGALLLAGVTLSILLGLKMGGVDYAWFSWQIVGLLVLGAALLAIFLIVETRVKEPILPLALLRSKVISGTLAATFLQGIMMFGALLYIPLFVQGSLGGDVGDAGNALTPLMLAVMVGASVGTLLIKRMSWRSNILLSMILTGTGLAAMIAMPLDVNVWLMRLIMVLIGMGIGIMMMVGQLAVSMSAEERFKGVATSTVGFTRSVGGVFGTAVLSAIINNRLASKIAEQADKLNLSTDGVQELADPRALLNADSRLPSATTAVLREVFGDAVQYGFWFLLAAAAVGVVAAVWTGSERYHSELEGKQAKVETKPHMM